MNADGRIVKPPVAKPQVILLWMLLACSAGVAAGAAAVVVFLLLLLVLLVLLACDRSDFRPCSMPITLGALGVPLPGPQSLGAGRGGVCVMALISEVFQDKPLLQC